MWQDQQIRSVVGSGSALPVTVEMGEEWAVLRCTGLGEGDERSEVI